MIKINVYEAKVHLSRYLAQLQKEKTILICKRNVPIAELRPLISARVKKRPVGLAKGDLRLTKDFFKPLPDDFVRAFEGKETTR